MSDGFKWGMHAQQNGHVVPAAGVPLVAAYVAFDAPHAGCSNSMSAPPAGPSRVTDLRVVAHGDGMVAGRRPKDSGRPRGRSSRGRPVVALAKPCHSSK
jgi:hypothetical protein